jgi:hypothetical protein
VAIEGADIAGTRVARANWSWGLGALEEAGDAALLPQGVERIVPAGEQLQA